MGESGEAGPERDPQLEAQGWAAGDPPALLQGEAPEPPALETAGRLLPPGAAVAVLRLSWGG